MAVSPRGPLRARALLQRCLWLGLLVALQACSPRPSATSFYNHFSGMALDDQDGRRFDVGQLLGRTVLVSFVFTGCSVVCPTQTRALAQLQKQLSADVRVHLLAVSVDPRQDTPAALKAYAESMGVDLGRASFVTGRPEDLERLSTALRLFRPGPELRVPDDHSTTLWLVDRAGELRMRYNGNPPDVDRLARELSQLDALAAGAR